MTWTPPNTFTNGTTADATAVDANFTGVGSIGEYADNIAVATGVNSSGTVRRGKSIIAGAGTRTSAAYGALSNGPDAVLGLVLPTDGLIVIGFQAVWQGSSTGANAAIFIGPNQLKGSTNGGTVVAETTQSAAGIDAPLSSCPAGVATSTAITPPVDVTTGQLVGISVSNSQFDGLCTVFAAAGTYDISVQFKNGGTITAKTRKLWAWTMGF